MPKYRAQLGGIEGSGQYMSPSGAVDFGGIVQALGTTATSLIQGAYARKLAQKNAAAAAAQLERTNQFKERELTGQEEERKARRLDIDAQRATRLAEIQQRRQDALDKEARDRAEREKNRAEDKAAKGLDDEHHKTHDVETARHNKTMEENARQIVMQGTDPATGAPSIIRLNKQTGEYDVTAGAGKPTTGGTQGMAGLKKLRAVNDAQLKGIARIESELRKYPAAVGLRMAGGDAINQRMDPKGRLVRSAIANVGSMIYHDRSGAAVTVSEDKRLRPFIPKETDTPETVYDKLASLAQFIRDENTALDVQLKSSVAPAPGGSQRAGGPTRLRIPAATSSTAPSELQAAWDAALARHGKETTLRELGPRPPR